MTAEQFSEVAPEGRRSVMLDHKGLILAPEGRRLALYSGSLHYWQLERATWRGVLQAIRSLGFTCVDTYIPWSVHEDAPGSFSFEGNRDVEAFLELCLSEGLFVIARPGPHINAELTEFGYPSRLLEDERIHARTASGATAIHVVPPKPFPIVSYCSEVFYQAADGWFDAICPLIAKYQYPEGPIVLVQADNEHSYFFKLTPYDVDYSEEAIGHYRSVLREKYTTIEALNREYQTEAESFEQLEPPTSFAARTSNDLPRYLDWALAKERYLTDGVSRIAAMLRAHGINRIPISHNSPGKFGVPYDHVSIERVVDVQGVDYYVHGREYDFLKRGCLYLSGTALLPFIPEFGAGTWPWMEPIDATDVEASALTALMYGIKAFNYYMLVERDRWLGSPVGRRGDLREDSAQVFRRLLTFLKETEWLSVERQVDVLLLDVRDYERLAFVSRVVSPPFFPELLGPLGDLGRHELFAERALGFDRVIPRDLRAWQAACHVQLGRAHYQYAVGDSQGALPWLQRFRAVVLPGYDFMSAELQTKLRGYAEAGGELVIGPKMPSVDERGRLCPILAESSASTIHLLASPDDIGATLTAVGLEPSWRLDDPELDLAIHRGADRSYLFIANPTATPRDATLQKPGVMEMRQAWGQPKLMQGDGAFAISLAPHDIQVWSC